MERLELRRVEDPSPRTGMTGAPPIAEDRHPGHPRSSESLSPGGRVDELAEERRVAVVAGFRGPGADFGPLPGPFLAAFQPAMGKQRNAGYEMDLGDPASSPCRRRLPAPARARCEWLARASPSCRAHRHRSRRGTRRRARAGEPAARTTGFVSSPVRVASRSTRSRCGTVWCVPKALPDPAVTCAPSMLAGFQFSEPLDATRRRHLGHYLRRHATHAIVRRKPLRYAMAGRHQRRAGEPQLVLRALAVAVGMLVEANWFPSGPEEHRLLPRSCPR